MSNMLEIEALIRLSMKKGTITSLEFEEKPDILFGQGKCFKMYQTIQPGYQLSQIRIAIR